MKIILILLSLIICRPGISQDQVRLEGRVLAKKDSTPVFNAHIFIKGTALGTSTNEQGYFQFNFANKYNKSGLLISSIGYRPALINGTEKDIVIFLEEDVLVLEEIVIKPIDPEKVLNKALQNYQENYYSGDIEKKIYYNENIVGDDEPLRKLEILADIGSKGFESNHKKPSIFILQKKPTFKKDETFFGNGIEVLYSLSWTGKYLKNSVFKNFDISFDGRANFLGHEVYQLKLTPQGRKDVITSVYVTAKDYAIIAIRESFRGRRKNIEERENEKFYFIESSQYVDFVQLASGKWHVNSIDDFRVSVNNEIITKTRRYIRVLSVKERKIETSSLPLDKETDLYNSEIPYVKQFWNTFNAPPSLDENL